MILTSTPIHEDLKNPDNTTLIDYNAFLRQLAPQKGCLLADLNADIQQGMQGPNGKIVHLTVDGVHMNPLGDQIMASGILSAFGLTDDQIAKAKDVWQDIPGGWGIQFYYRDPAPKPAPTVPAVPAVPATPAAPGTPVAPPGPVAPPAPAAPRPRPAALTITESITIRQYEALDKIAALKNGSEASTEANFFTAAVKSFLQPQGAYESIQAINDAGQLAAVTAQVQQKVDQDVADQLKAAGIN